MCKTILTREIRGQITGRKVTTSGRTTNIEMDTNENILEEEEQIRRGGIKRRDRGRNEGKRC